MKPNAFNYARPATVERAASLLAESGFAKVLAGGQSLGPMLNLRLARPDLLVDLTHIASLKQAVETKDAVEIGACVTHANIEDGLVPDVTNGMLPSVASNIAYRAVRNRGTIGGSLSHADPAADWVSTLTALDAEIVIRGGKGQRRLSMAAYMRGTFDVALEEGEFLEMVRVPKLSKSARWGYYKFCRKAGEFAEAIGVVVRDPERGVCRAVMGATHSTPILVADATNLLGNGFDAAGAEALLDSHEVTDAYERQLHVEALRRAHVQAGV